MPTLPSLSLCFLAALAVSAPLTGCGGGGGGSSASTPASSTITAPNSIPAGVVMSFGGLTLTFTGGTSLTYANSGNPDFTASLSSAGAVYSSIDPGSSPLASLLLSGVGAGEPGKLLSGNGTETMQLSFSRMENGILKEAVVTIGGKTYTATFSGTPLPKGSSVSTTTPPPASANEVPAVAQGSYSLTFGIDRGVSGCPWSSGQAAAITLAANSLTINGKTLPLDRKVNENGDFYFFKDGALEYRVEGAGWLNGSGKVTAIVVLCNGAYAGQLSYTNPVNTTNDPTRSIVGKRFIVVCVQSDNTIDGTTPSGAAWTPVGATGVVEVSTSVGELDFKTVSGDVAAGGNASYDGVSSVGTGVGSYLGGGEHRTTAYYDVKAKTLTRLVISRVLPTATYTYTYDVVGQN